MTKIRQRADYTFKYNRNLARHGWLRLTPAYSVRLVDKLIAQAKPGNQAKIFILDPFSGTATTGLVAAQTGYSAHLYDINPFLIWLGNIKCANYSIDDIASLEQFGRTIISRYKKYLTLKNWTPNIYKIDRWWAKQTLKILAAIRRVIAEELGEPDNNINGLVWVGFCRLAIETSAASFNHVSMSFQNKTDIYAAQTIDILFSEILNNIFASASHSIAGLAQVYKVDSRLIRPNGARYTHVITSPPYPNRISYIRELRPYMYWLKFLDEAREAGELDWEAIGGTWGIATSRLKNWTPEHSNLPDELYKVCNSIADSGGKNALLMSRYVHKYFHDMHQHFDTLRNTLAANAKLQYIVGNSTFYGVPVNTEQLISLILQRLDYHNISHQVVRKRNSKKALFEFCVSATWQ